jgi:hypothetical protein
LGVRDVEEGKRRRMDGEVGKVIGGVIAIWFEFR